MPEDDRTGGWWVFRFTSQWAQGRFVESWEGTGSRSQKGAWDPRDRVWLALVSLLPLGPLWALAALEYCLAAWLPVKMSPS